MAHPIESEKKSERKAQEFTLLTEEDADDSIVVYSKILNRDFIGFNDESKFSSKFVMNERWVRTIQPREITGVLKIEGKATKREVARHLTRKYYELSQYVARKSRWEQVYYSKMFDAIAVGLICYVELADSWRNENHSYKFPSANKGQS